MPSRDTHSAEIGHSTPAIGRLNLACLSFHPVWIMASAETNTAGMFLPSRFTPAVWNNHFSGKCQAFAHIVASCMKLAYQTTKLCTNLSSHKVQAVLSADRVWVVFAKLLRIDGESPFQ